MYISSSSSRAIINHHTGVRYLYYLTDINTMDCNTSFQSQIEKVYRYVHIYVKGRKEMFHLTTHSTHFIYGYMASDIW